MIDIGSGPSLSFSCAIHRVRSKYSYFPFHLLFSWFAHISLDKNANHSVECGPKAIAVPVMMKEERKRQPMDHFQVCHARASIKLILEIVINITDVAGRWGEVGYGL